MGAQTIFDPDGNQLIWVRDAGGRVHLVVENEQAARRSQQITLASTEIVELVYDLLQLVQDDEGSDFVDQAIQALKPYADQRDLLATRTTS